MTSRIAVIGTGYVGLTTGACLAHLGHDVVCADIDQAKVDALNAGAVPILEDGLDNLVLEGRRSGRLRFVVGAAGAVGDREFVCLCVPTPQGDDGSADLSYIEGAAREIGPALASEAIVINKSTVPVGSTRVVEQALQRGDVFVVSNPEFLREGSAVHDFLNPDRVVIGANDQAAAIRMAGLYIGLTAPIMVTDPASAETIKYASNAFLATKISFVNAVAAVCEAVGADVNDVVLGMGYDRRIGQDFLRPGPGWGGSCFPKDTIALIRIAEDAGYDFRLLRGVVDVNNEQFERVVRKVVAAVGGDVRGKRLASWGLTFKARTDDTRMSPAIEVIKRLQSLGADVVAYDPAIRSEIEGIPVVSTPTEAVDGAELLMVLTEWDEFKWVDLDEVGAKMASKRIVDTRNLLDRNRAQRAGFNYEGIGRR
ncbi:MAG TPA: UDP-glucose/GDP-mannose dehydrogenase family protein [Microthrixaceae bacterium]|nr:UDP-glucose/GDP-mannose dehydrogenase family protein [Microthrixaceae bacterium]HMT22846.1 UDP-glucose/GDP-mannose dehydrogenase family protein [Microthrixaceae bacterium]HMT60889.1 UDP-glucose/GDP-mannose dehydrogenase family protein [Microthrixaceae bacterium]